MYCQQRFVVKRTSLPQLKKLDMAGHAGGFPCLDFKEKRRSKKTISNYLSFQKHPQHPQSTPSQIQSVLFLNAFPQFLFFNDASKSGAKCLDVYRSFGPVFYARVMGEYSKEVSRQ